MKEMRQAHELIARLERGDLNHDLSTAIEETLKTLQDRAPPKGKAKGQVKLTIDFTVQGNTVDIDASIDTKVPKPIRARSTYFVTPAGAISTEHPQQDDTFEKPRVVRETA